MTDAWWRPAPGERVGLERARLILDRFGPAIRAVGRQAAAQLRERHPGQRVTGRIFTPEQVATYLMDEGAGRIAVAVVWQDDPRSGYPASHPVVVQWDSGEVLAVDRQGEAIARASGPG